MLTKKIKKTDKIITIVCISGFIITGIIFYINYTSTLTKLNEEPVGTIVFKKRIAQRKFVDRVVWDRLGQSSPIYNGDTIRTIEFSEGIINFKDEITYLTVNENTMIQIFYSEKDGAKIELSEGKLEVDSSSRNVAVISGSSKISVKGQANLTRSEGELSLSVLEGEAAFNGDKLLAGDLLALDADGIPAATPSIAITSFGSSARILAGSNGKADVVFSWNAFNFADNTNVIVEVALDRRYNRIAGSKTVTGSSSVSIPIEHGSYWWRAYPANRGSNVPLNKIYPSGTLEVIHAPAVQLLSPKTASEHIAPDEVVFSWTSVKGASSYLLEISDDADMENPVISRQVKKTWVKQSGLEKMRWYWRITPVFPHWITGGQPPSVVGNFFIVQELSKPVPALEITVAAELPKDKPEQKKEIIPEPPKTVAARQDAKPRQTQAQPQTQTQPQAKTQAPAAPAREHWGSFVDEKSTATLKFSVNNQGVCTVTVGGSSMRLNPGRASVNYRHTVNKGKKYKYEFEAWTETGTRSLPILNPSNYEAVLLITDIRKTHTITSRAMPETGQVFLRFHSGNQTGTYYLRIISITEF